MEEMIQTRVTDITWQYVSLLYQQFIGMQQKTCWWFLVNRFVYNYIKMNLLGLMEGYAVTAPQDQHMDTFGFDFLTGNGDWLDIQYIIDNDGIFEEKRKAVCHLSRDSKSFQ